MTKLRYALLLITILAAVVTPKPDAATLLIFMLSIVALYAISKFAQGHQG